MVNKFYMRTYRKCTRRNADSQKIYDHLIANNWTFTDKIHLADLIVICTCGATDKTEHWSLDNIEDIIKRKSETAEVIITGCLPIINPERIQKLGKFRTIPPKNLDEFDEILNSKIKIRDIPEVGTICVPDFIEKQKESLENKVKRYVNKFSLSVDFVKYFIRNAKRRIEQLIPSYDIRIAKGCLSNCSYCVIKFATGRLESKPISQILDELKIGLKKGYKQFRFVAVDTGCYGIDNGTNIINLLRSTFALEESFKLSITDFNPQWMIKFYEELAPIFKRNRNRISGLSIPIQSGSNRILRLMKRPYKIENVKSILKNINKEFPEFRLKTQIIVGFPGETVAEFEETKNLVKEFNFFGVEVFKYNDRPNVESEKMECKITESVKTRRAKELLDLGGTLQN